MASLQPWLQHCNPAVAMNATTVTLTPGRAGSRCSRSGSPAPWPVVPPYPRWR